MHAIYWSKCKSNKTTNIRQGTTTSNIYIYMQCTGSTVQVTGTDTRLSEYSVSVGTVLNMHDSPNTSSDTTSSTVQHWHGYSPSSNKLKCIIVYPTIWQYRPNLVRRLHVLTASSKAWHEYSTTYWQSRPRLARLLLLILWYHPNPVWIRNHDRQYRPKLVRSLAQISGVDE